jgi:peptide deformylase
MAVRPIVTYNDPVLKQVAKPVTKNTPNLDTFIQDMFDTMSHAKGLGLAAPQVGRSIRLFVIDADGLDDETPSESTPIGRRVILNPEILSESEDLVTFEEGCLSLPDLRDQVSRPSDVTVRFQDASFETHEMSLRGWTARVFLHEMDHLEGILFIDRISAFKRALHNAKLASIDANEVDAGYDVAPKSSRS